jgi:uncharacterized membrane protein YkvA (DUF1232 family)
MHNYEKYGEHYDENSFWNKIKGLFSKAGQELIEQALTLYYVMKAPDTPMAVKGSIVAALGYLISPIDAIPDVIPVLGYSDDLAVLTLVIYLIANHITPAIERQVQRKIAEFN